MAENEIITSENPQMQLFTQMMEGVLAKLERYCQVLLEQVLNSTPPMAG